MNKVGRDVEIMIIIKCCATACKYNSYKYNKSDYSGIAHYGDCMFDGEIVLDEIECEDCGNDDVGVWCNSFKSRF